MKNWRRNWLFYPFHSSNTWLLLFIIIFDLQAGDGAGQQMRVRARRLRKPACQARLQWLQKVLKHIPVQHMRWPRQTWAGRGKHAVPQSKQARIGSSSFVLLPRENKKKNRKKKKKEKEEEEEEEKN